VVLGLPGDLPSLLLTLLFSVLLLLLLLPRFGDFGDFLLSAVGAALGEFPFRGFFSPGSPPVVVVDVVVAVVGAPGLTLVDLCSAASLFVTLSCFFHLVRRFWNQA